jgi:GNAT superfamily N-acetyltransferase
MAVGEERSGDTTVSILRVAEAEIDEALSGELQALLQVCFPGYPDRSYFKLPPHFRYLVRTSDGAVAAQMGVEHRVVRVADRVVRTFGVVDLCVRPSKRSRGLAAELLAEVTGFAHSCKMDFILLFADDDRLYVRNGWTRVRNRCTWVQIDNHTTLGLARQADPEAMMVKAIGPQTWPDGDVDLLGHVF